MKSPPIPFMAILDSLSKAKSDKRIEKIITDAWNRDSEEFFLGLQYSMDPLVDYKIHKCPRYEEDIDEDGDFTFDDFFILTNKIIKAKNISLEEIQDLIRDAASKANPKEWNNFYRRIILKELQNDIKISSIIPVLSKLTNQNFTSNIQHKTKNNILRDS